MTKWQKLLNWVEVDLQAMFHYSLDYLCLFEIFISKDTLSLWLMISTIWVHTTYIDLNFFLYLSIWYLSYIRGEIWFLYNNWLSKWDIFSEKFQSFLGICLSAQRIYTYILPTADDYCHTVMFNAYLTRSGQSLHFWSYPHGHFSASVWPLLECTFKSAELCKERYLWLIWMNLNILPTQILRW